MSYKLTYFDVRARAETSRMLFALAQQNYEDIRVDKEKWQELKPKSPFGALPMLEVNGHCFCQTHAIERFLARRFNLYGKGELEQTKADMVVDCIEDWVKPLAKIFMAQTEEEKEKLRKEYAEDSMPKLLAKLNEMVSDGGYFLGSQLMWPDVGFYNAHVWPGIMGIKLDLSKYPKLKGVVEKVEHNPQIADWLKKRPDNSM